MSSSEDYYLNFIGIIDGKELDNDIIFKDYDINYINLTTLPIVYYPIYNNRLLNDNIISSINTKIDDISTLSGGDATTKKNNLKKTIKKRFDESIKLMELDKKLYNRYLITPIAILLLILWIVMLLFILKYIHINYNIYYLYIIISIIGVLLIFGSVWFLYVNSQL